MKTTIFKFLWMKLWKYIYLYFKTSQFRVYRGFPRQALLGSAGAPGAGGLLGSAGPGALVASPVFSMDANEALKVGKYYSYFNFCLRY